MTMKAKHSNPWRSSARGTQTRMMSDRMQPRLHAVFPSLLSQWGLPRETWRCSAQQPGRRRHNRQLSFPATTKLQTTANSNTSRKVSVFTPFCEKLFEYHSEIKIHTCTKFIKTLEWFVFLLVDFSSQSNDKTFLWMKFSPMFPFLSFLFSISPTPMLWSLSCLLN